MRSIIIAFSLLVLPTLAIAAENSDAPKQVLVKGSKSYQVRYAKPTQNVDLIEPAAGNEIENLKKDNASHNTSSDDDAVSKKEMKLHNRR